MPAACASLTTCIGLVLSCGALGNQPMRSARTLKSIMLPLYAALSAALSVGETISSMPSFS
ncbi:hypothetical protein D9M69_633640 [compost metagenome]